MQKIKNFSLFSNSGIGEYGTNNINISFDNQSFSIETNIANELLEERAEIFRSNYPNTNMITGSITDIDIQKKIIKNFKSSLPITGTFSPPCQGSSGLNAFKNNPFDFRNQLVKSVFKILNSLHEEKVLSLEFGYIENVVAFYKENIPALYFHKNEDNLFFDFIESNQGYLNYQYFILSDDEKLLDNFKSFFEFKLFNIKNNSFNKKFAFAFNLDKDINSNTQLISTIQNSLDFNTNVFIKSINTFEFIQKSFHNLGYKTILKTVRGEEYGGCQVRQRGFVIFHKNNLNMNFPTTFYKKSTDISFKGKTVLDALKVLNLIKILDINDIKNPLLKIHPYKIHNNKIYVDMSISEEKAQKELIVWNNNNCPHDNLPNLHFRQDLKRRFEIWLENTPEGKSAYSNKKRIHRPYKIIQVSFDKNNNFIVKNNQQFVVEEDNPEYFIKNNIIDYIEFVTDDMKLREGNKEWGENCRKWQIKNINDRKIIEKNAVSKAKTLLLKNKEVKSYYIFMPIKGFEAATYKRASLNKVSSALTTKNSIGNSNTCHPIFNRTWTPLEYMALFGIGYILENDEYKVSIPYIPPKGILKIKSFANLLFEIHGEAIISTVAEQIMKSLLLQYLKQV